MTELKHIVCPTDFSDFSRRALDHALALARWYDADVTVLHTIPQVLMPPEFYPYLSEPVTPDPEVRERALGELGRFVHRAREEGVAVEVRLEEGDFEAHRAVTRRPPRHGHSRSAWLREVGFGLGYRKGASHGEVPGADGFDEA